MSIDVRFSELGLQAKRYADGEVKYAFNRTDGPKVLDLRNLPPEIVRAARTLCAYGIDSKPAMWTVYYDADTNTRQSLSSAAREIAKYMKTTNWYIESCVAVLDLPEPFIPRDDYFDGYFSDM